MPLRPIYREAQTLVNTLPEGGNAGLWYDKFCNLWDYRPNTGQTILADKGGWVKTVTQKPVGNLEWLEFYGLRIEELVRQQGGLTQVLTTESRFVTGLGRPHPLENGFAWHTTLGTPYLPGSSLKGLVRDWAEAWEDWSAEGNIDKNLLLRRLLGDPDTGMGEIIFMDACPLEPVTLEPEIMTPHYSPYYTGNELPGDWYSPVPIPFLTVAAKQAFLFAVLPAHPGVDQQEMARVMDWVIQGLNWLGAGAKTAVGYGRFSEDGAKTKKWHHRLEQERNAALARAKESEQTQKLAQMSPLQQEMESDGYSQDEQRFMTALSQKWLNRLSEPSEASEIAELLAAWYQTNKPDQWKKPNKKNEEKIQRIRAALAKR